MRWWGYVLAGCLAYLFTVVASLPIQHVVNQLTSSGLPLVIGQISGTIWQGGAERVSYRELPLGPVEWRFAPLGLLQGRIEYAIALNHPDHTLDGYVAKGLLSEGFDLTELKGRMSADSLLKLADLSDLSASGQLELELRELQVSGQHIVAAEGEIRWLNAGIERPVRADFGDLQFILSADEQAVKSDINELDGPLQVNGEFFLRPDGSYQFKGKVKANNGADPGLISLLESIGRPAGDGGILIDHSGQM
jgi:general secretion pathway protein N